MPWRLFRNKAEGCNWRSEIISIEDSVHRSKPGVFGQATDLQCHRVRYSTAIIVDSLEPHFSLDTRRDWQSIQDKPFSFSWRDHRSIFTFDLFAIQYKCYSGERNMESAGIAYFKCGFNAVLHQFPLQA